LSRWVLDASALLALLNGESGSERVAEVLPDTAIASVNFSEVVAKLADEGRDESEIRSYLDALGLKILEFNAELAYQTGFLRPLTRSIGLSLGDRACLALAVSLGVPALTCDRVWTTLSLGVTIELIR
jgi:ribonuclease VapC